MGIPFPNYVMKFMLQSPRIDIHPRVRHRVLILVDAVDIPNPVTTDEPPEDGTEVSILIVIQVRFFIEPLAGEQVGVAYLACAVRSAAPRSIPPLRRRRVRSYPRLSAPRFAAYSPCSQPITLFGCALTISAAWKFVKLKLYDTRAATLDASPRAEAHPQREWRPLCHTQYPCTPRSRSGCLASLPSARPA